MKNKLFVWELLVVCRCVFISWKWYVYLRNMLKIYKDNENELKKERILLYKILNDVCFNNNYSDLVVDVIVYCYVYWRIYFYGF